MAYTAHSGAHMRRLRADGAVMLRVASGLLVAGLISDSVGMDELSPGWAYGDDTSDKFDGDSNGANEDEKGS